LGSPRAKPNTSLNRKFGFRFGSKIQSQFLAAAFFKLCLSLVFNQQVFKFGFFVQQVSFHQQSFGLVFQVAKTGYKVLGLRFGLRWF